MKSFRVSNFRLFGSQGTEIKFKPITVLTGANSSGKSSFVKALVTFGEYMDSVINELRRDGSYNPFRVKLDFSDPKLKMKGFSSVVNRDLPKEAFMTFSTELFPTISCFGSYNVSYSFGADDPENPLDQGVLQSISLDIEGDPVLRIERKNNNQDSQTEEAQITYLNLNHLLADFIAFCRYCILPNQIINESRDEYSGSYDPEFYDDEGQFSVEMASETAVGKRLAIIQKRDSATFDFYHIANRIPHEVNNQTRPLFARDLFDAVEKCVEHDLFFYFPVLEKFLGKSKEESVAILNRDCSYSVSLQFIRPEESILKSNLEKLIHDYESSETESFIDYYRGLENYILENYDKSRIYFIRSRKSFNFIEDRILQNIAVSYDDGGFETRHDDEAKAFSIAYDVLSSWQWAEDEKKDEEWMHFNSEAVTDLWGKDSAFLTRHISDYQGIGSFSSKHILHEAFKDFVDCIMNECLLPKDLTRLEYNTGSFASVQRLHSFEENSDFVRTIKSYLDERSYYQRFCVKPIWRKEHENHYVPDSFLNKWLGNEGLGICERIKVDNVEGLGFKIIAVKADEVEEALADMGHGVTQMVSLLLQIENALTKREIIDYERAKADFEKGDWEEDQGTIIAIEEPEVSLHPCYQSRLAEILRDAVSYGNDLSFIIETHSEYLVRKMQAIVSSFSKEQFEAIPFVVYYFKSDGEAYDLGFTETGRFENGFGPGFFDEASNLKYELLSEEMKNNG